MPYDPNGPNSPNNVNNALAPPGLADTRRIDYWLAGGGGLGLARQEQTAILGIDAAPGTEPPDVGDPNSKLIIAPEVKSLQFQYFDGAAWQDVWDGTQPGGDGVTPMGPPAAVAITIGLRARRRRRPEDVPPRHRHPGSQRLDLGADRQRRRGHDHRDHGQQQSVERQQQSEFVEQHKPVGRGPRTRVKWKDDMRYPNRTHGRARRRGIAMLAVLVVVAILALAAYRFSDLMAAEQQAADSYSRAIQARANADSGINYAAAQLASAYLAGSNNQTRKQLLRQPVPVSGDPRAGRRHGTAARPLQHRQPRRPRRGRHRRYQPAFPLRRHRRDRQAQHQLPLQAR